MASRPFRILPADSALIGNNMVMRACGALLPIVNPNGYGIVTGTSVAAGVSALSTVLDLSGYDTFYFTFAASVGVGTFALDLDPINPQTGGSIGITIATGIVTGVAGAQSMFVFGRQGPAVSQFPYFLMRLLIRNTGAVPATITNPSALICGS